MSHDTPDAYAIHLDTGQVEIYTTCREADGGYELTRPQRPFGTERRWLPRKMVERATPMWRAEQQRTARTQ